MSHRAVGRVSAATGLVYVIVSLLAGFVYPQQPRNDSPAMTTIAWVHGHRVALQVGMLFGLLAAGVFLWFVGVLRTLFDDGGDNDRSLAPMVFGAGIAVAVVSALAALPIALLAYMDAQPLGLTDHGVVRMLGDLNIVLFRQRFDHDGSVPPRPGSLLPPTAASRTVMARVVEPGRGGPQHGGRLGGADLQHVPREGLECGRLRCLRRVSAGGSDHQRGADVVDPGSK